MTTPNPDIWMPYYGADFEGAMKGYRREVKWSYISALWHYWSHCHCEGLPDDSQQLQLLCECPDQDWLRTKGVIFSGRPYFYLENGRWHQDRARTEYRIAIEQREKRRKQTEAARKTKNVTGPVTDVVTGRPVPVPVQLHKGEVSPSVKAILADKELKRVESRLQEVRDSARTTAMGKLYSAEAKAELVSLKARKKELLAVLEFKA